MRILVENSGYHLRNMGDLAMLQVAIDRLQKFWPNALIQVFTKSPERLIEYCPHTLPLSAAGRKIWLSPLINTKKYIPSKRATRQWANIECKLKDSFPSLVSSFLKLKLKNKPDSAKHFEEFIDAVSNADLVVASGGGYITSTFKPTAIGALETLGLASKLGKPTVMFGHGLGPINDDQLLNRAKAVLPSVNLITLREKRAGIPLLKSIGVSNEHVITTGDDAVELAYQARSETLGNAIGVNLRVAKYSNVDRSVIEVVRSSLHDVAKNHDAALLPAPIDHLFLEGYVEPDSVTIQQLLEGYDDTSDGGKSLDTPLKVIKQVGRCRVVVTGSYHAGVFALSQGIPVIGLAKSMYYVDKFSGLAEQFGVGCEVVLLEDPQLKTKLVASINKAWESSEKLRPLLLEAAVKQIDLGLAAYKRMYDMVASW